MHNDVTNTAAKDRPHRLHCTYPKLPLPACTTLHGPSLQFVLVLPVLLEFALLPAALVQSRTSNSLVAAITATFRAAIGMFAFLLAIAPIQVAATILEKIVDEGKVLHIMIRWAPVSSVVDSPQ